MGRKNTDRRSFFEWAVPDHVVDYSKLWRLGILGLLLAVVLAYCGVQSTRHLSVDGGSDQIAAGYPGFDGGIPQDQVAAGFPGNDDPEGLSIVNEPEVDTEDDEDKTPVDEEPAEDKSVGQDISTEQNDVDVSRFGTGTWDITIRESGEAACGYPEGSYEYPATITIGIAPAGGGGEVDVEQEDWSDTVTLLRFKFQLNSGPGSVLPLGLSGGDDTHSSQITITELDVDNGTLAATEIYRSGDCTTTRTLIGLGF